MEKTNLFPTFAEFANNESYNRYSEIEDIVDEGSNSNNDTKVIETIASTFNNWATNIIENWESKDEEITEKYESADDYVQSAKTHLIDDLVKRLDEAKKGTDKISDKIDNGYAGIQNLVIGFTNWSKDIKKGWKDVDEEIKNEYGDADDYIEAAKTELIAELVEELYGTAIIKNRGKMTIDFR